MTAFSICLAIRHCEGAFFATEAISSPAGRGLRRVYNEHNEYAINEHYKLFWQFAKKTPRMVNESTNDDTIRACL